MFQPQENLICNDMNLSSFREYLLLENEEWKVTDLEVDHKINTRVKLQQINKSTRQEANNKKMVKLLFMAMTWLRLTRRRMIRCW